MFVKSFLGESVLSIRPKITNTLCPTGLQFREWKKKKVQSKEKRKEYSGRVTDGKTDG